MTSLRTAGDLIVAGVIATLLLVGCGSDSEANSDPATEVDPVAASTPVTDAAPTAGVVTGAAICQQLTTESVATDLGVEVTAAVPDDSATPQCAYEYTNDTGSTSNLTVAFMRPADVGGRTGVDAYDFTLGINRAFAGDDEQEVDAGDDAVRLSGSGVHVGVLRVGDQVYTLIVPVDDAEPTAVETLIGTMATTLG
ncbi:MAG TPA: hypothetical protein VES40_14965 [Ilumatobacteraceae bacterium]|nr:hypothetical protein [Ilumatobacteraceae bacterium]